MRFVLLLLSFLLVGRAEAADVSPIAAPTPSPAALQVATFAGGCFWCVEAVFDGIDGVTKAEVGYTGGTVENPSYRQVSTGKTGHVEAIEVTFDPARVSYAKLLDAFWRNIDPTDPDGQFCDKGTQYRAAIFYHDAAQEKAAKESARKASAMLGLNELAVSLRPAGKFWPAEAEHQGYHERESVRYKIYEYSCGRPQRVQAIWGRLGPMEKP